MEKNDATKQIISILVDNAPGVLSRIAGLFSRRGYNIDALSVCATEDERYSRMTVTLSANAATTKQIIAQLEKQEEVVKVVGFDGVAVAFRELLLIKIVANAAERSEVVDLCTLFEAKAIDITPNAMILELTGSTDKVDAFMQVVSASYKILEMARTGGAALEKGDAVMANGANE